MFKRNEDIHQACALHVQGIKDAVGIPKHAYGEKPAGIEQGAEDTDLLRVSMRTCGERPCAATQHLLPKKLVTIQQVWQQFASGPTANPTQARRVCQWAAQEA